MLSLCVVVGLLVAWFLAFGDGGRKYDTGRAEGKNPAPSITPGPSGSGPAISEHPGGRDEASNGGTSGGSPSQGGSQDPGNGAGGGTGGGTEGDEGTSGTGGGSQAGGGSGAEIPAGSSLPTCAAGTVKLSLHATPNSYGPGETPHIQLTAKNTSSTSCKIDLGPRHTVMTITSTDGDEQLWASDDCPASSGSHFFRVPADSSISQTTTWNRKPSAPHCATPSAGSAGAGTYLVQAKTPGFATARTSFVLAKD